MGAARMIILGLDGATFEVLDPLIAAGKLPALAALRAAAAYGRLRSTLPAVTGPAWMSLATGKNPGRTGVFDFRNVARNGDLKLEPMGSQDFIRHGALWHHLNGGGLRVGILNYPMLYPAYQIDGFMVGGLGSPLDVRLTYPADLKSALDTETGGYEIDVPYNDPQYAGDTNRFIHDLNRVMRKHERAVLYLLEQGDVDVFFAVLPASDLLQHVLWRAWEEPHAVADGARLREEFIKAWQHLDRLVDAVIQKAAADAYVVVLSDHGFGSYTRSFLINQWLEDEGYLVRRTRGSDKRAALRANRVVRALARLMPAVYRRTVNALRERLFMPFRETLDLAHTVAFALDHSSVGHVYINTRSRSGCGPVVDAAHHAAVRHEIMQRLQNFLQSNARAVDIRRAEEVYTGPALDRLPDIVFTVDDMDCDVVPTRFEHPVLRPRVVPIRTGDHRRDGVFICRGPRIHAADLGVIDITDVAPTALSLLGCEIPSDMDGRVITDMLSGKAFDARERQEAAVRAPEIGTQYSARSDDGEVERRLRQLGYLE